MVATTTKLAALLAAAAGTASAYNVRVTFFDPMFAPGVNSKASCDGLGGLWDGSVCAHSANLAALSAVGLLAVEHFNSRDGTYVSEFGQLGACEATLVPQVLDSGFDSEVVVRNTLEMMQQVPATDVVVGPATSGGSISQALINGALDIPQLSYWATSTELDKPTYKRFMRTIPSDGDVADAVCAYWEELGYEHVGMLYVNDGYGDAYKEAIVESCTRRNLKNVYTFPYVQGDAANIAKQVLKLNQTNVRAFLLVSLDGSLATIVDEGNKHGMFEDSMWILSDGIGSGELNGLSAEHKRLFHGALRVVATGGAPSNPVWTKFRADFASLKVSGLQRRAEDWPAAWTALGDKVFSDINPDEGEIRNVATFMYDAVAAVGIGACRLSNTALGANFGTRFYNSAGGIKFSGLSGNVQFNDYGGRDRLTASYEIANVLFGDSRDGQLEFTTRGQFLNGAWQFDSQPVFSSGMTATPADTWREPENRNYSGSYRYVLYVLGGINLTLAGGFMIWTVAKRNHLIVRASQVVFLACISLGVMISSSSIFLFTVDDEFADDPDASSSGDFGIANSACMASVWLYSMGFTIAFGALFARMWRIRRLFRSRSNFKRVVVPNSLLFMIIITLLAVDVTILAAWTLADPLLYVRTTLVLDNFGDSAVSSGMCQSDLSLIFLLLLGSFHFGILIVGNYIGWKTRGVNSTFSEGKYVGIAMWSYVQVLLLGIPVVLSVAGNATTLMFVKGGVVFLNDFSLLMFLFMPKVIGVHWQNVDTSGQGGELLETVNNSSSKGGSATINKKNNKVYTNPSSHNDNTDDHDDTVMSSFQGGSTFTPSMHFRDAKGEVHI